MTTGAKLIVGLTPLIGVFDMPEALAFYRDLLGFEIVFASPEVDTPEGRFSHFVRLRLGAADLMLNTQYDSGERPAKRTAANGGACFYIHCSDVDAVYEWLVRRGLKAEAPGMAPYGLRGFSVKDPDGNIVVFQEINP